MFITNCICYLNIIEPLTVVSARDATIDYALCILISSFKHKFKKIAVKLVKTQKRHKF